MPQLPPRVVRRVVRLSLAGLAFYALFLWGAAHLPGIWAWLGPLAVTLAFAAVVTYLLDRMVPGVNILSRAASHLPPSASVDAVALSFDDGPVEPYTWQILDLLDRYGAKATFFCLGENVDRAPDLVAEIVRRGHAVGNHTYSHRTLPSLSSAEIRDEIERGAASIERATGKRPTLLRCPKGYKSARVCRIARALGFEVIGFTFPIFDVENPPPEVLTARFLARVRAGDIPVMHDGYASHKPGARDSLIAALPPILEGLRAKGLRSIALKT